MHIREYLDYNGLAEYVRNGYIDAHLHDSLPLVLFTYARKTVYEGLWDEITTRCRGLIVTASGEIVARPFEKFFNIGERPETQAAVLPNTTPIIMEKVDGSLGILYRYNGQEAIASKGSFNSDHAKWATQWYHKHCKNAQWPDGYTVVFEMVCESIQHHVVHYGKEELKLIALINIDTGEEADYNTLYNWAYINGLSVPKVYTHCEQNAVNAEGYVLSWPRKGQPPFKVKLKFPDFLKKQKIMHSTGPKQILEMLKNGESFDSILDNSISEFAAWVSSWAMELTKEFDKHMTNAADIYNSAVLELGGADRKQYALYFLHPDRRKYSGVTFAMLDENPEEITKAVWKMVQPMVKGVAGFSTIEDDE